MTTHGIFVSLSASLEQLRGQERTHPVSNCNTFLIQHGLQIHNSQDMPFTPFSFTRVHSTTVNSVLVSLKATARVVAAKVAEAVKEVEVVKAAGPRHLHLETVALIGRIATNLH